MLRNRTILLALLIPLLLNLLAAFVAEPLRDRNIQTCIEQNDDLCRIDGTVLGRECLEEEIRVCFCGTPGRRHTVAFDHPGCAGDIVFMASTTGFPMAGGWRMPLRI